MEDGEMTEHVIGNRSSFVSSTPVIIIHVIIDTIIIPLTTNIVDEVIVMIGRRFQFRLRRCFAHTSPRDNPS
ncbi:uncharacterized protein K444DRAFT_134591 [Hyaloscypha bicolor E]|uniref:Uncharacterized protein n=1 Tax=Hyaloscypha bicolor E TaxID=1095630 RepID=A0A2J6STH4_9HELO|nr:uncharacterized protein K444DRAFT_134591 [Hyaloscypha bicolor E]PMD54047.1 hypothetical protein K444DRAFT_134591 [Hyaloscypha bicolor E]